MNVRVMTFSIMLVLGIGIHNVFASDIASLIPTGNENITITPPQSPAPSPTLTPTPTPPIPFNNPSTPPLKPLGLSKEIPLGTMKPTIQQVNPSNTNTGVRSMLVNYSLYDNIEVDEDANGLTITISQVEDAEPMEEETASDVTDDVGEEEDAGEDDDNNDNNDNNDNDNNDGDGKGRGTGKGKGNGKDK
jgi:hypothetical protein